MQVECFTQFQTLKGNASWEVVLYIPDNICEDIRGNIDSGACGFNNVCNLQDGRPNCKCLRGFSIVNPDDPNGGCKPDLLQAVIMKVSLIMEETCLVSSS